MRRGRPLRVPLRPHVRGERGVPHPHCGCETCIVVRNEQRADAEGVHWQRVGEIVGVDDKDEAK